MSGRSQTRVVRVVPDVPSFAVDDGFAYAVPESIGGVTVGSVVRVPLGGRRVRGWVVAEMDAGSVEVGRLRSVLSRSGDAPIFDTRLLGVLRWAAIHYVSPLAGLLPRAGPPNLPRGSRMDVRPKDLAGAPRRTSFISGAGPWIEPIGRAVEPILDAHGTVLVVVPSVAEAEATATALDARFPKAVRRAWSALPASEVTRSWVLAGRGRTVVVGTRETAPWHVPALALAFVVGPGRRALKAKQTPTLHARDILRKRANVERFALTFAGPVAPSELVAAGVHVVRPRARAWSLVEIVARDSQAPGAGLILERTRAAIHGVTAGGGKVFVFVPRRGYAPAHRCARCGTVRRCAECGAGPDRGDVCRRCGSPVGPCAQCGSSRFQALGIAVGTVVEDLRRSLGSSVAPSGSGAAVEVGTERDAPPPGSRDLAVALEPDALWLAPHYRAEEEAIRVLARVASTVRRGRGRRCLVQTSQPGHRVLVALRSGDAAGLMNELIAERSSAGFPPAGELIAIELRGERHQADDDLRSAVGDDGEVFGPADAGDRRRWLVQGPALHAARVRLRSTVQTWRDSGLSVRVDADPIDL